MVHIVIGTKAQLVKMAPVMANLANSGIQYNFIYTGQHRATIEDMLSDFGLKNPDIILYDCKDITSIFMMVVWTFQLLIVAFFKKKLIFQGDKKGIVLVHGDTVSTLLGALMGKIAGLKVGHVESGLRSFNIFHPFPEEITRILTFRLSDILFCPGKWALDNVSQLKKVKVNTVENTLYDCINLWCQKDERIDHIPTYNFVLVSIHRFENIFSRKRLEVIVNILEIISNYYNLIFILHKPTEKKLKQMLFFDRLKNNKFIEFRERYNHSDFVALLKKCNFVVTDGGSLQEETYFLGIPCLLLRKTTERMEGIGLNVVVSNYDIDVVKNFCEKYQFLNLIKIKKEFSPSQLIVNEVKKFA
jgi:UDP-N-acetylglucosamine 2-epimerase (non-hydrolysing)